MDDGGLGRLRAAHTGPLSVDEILHEMNEEIARRGGRGLPAPGAADLQPASQAPSPVPGDADITLSDLLGQEGPAFVVLAYRVILGRAPDETGQRCLLGALAEGRDKIELLGGLRLSPEGRRVGRRIPGLMPRYLAWRLYRLPVVGRPLRLATALPRVPRMMRDMAAISRTQGAQQASVAELAHAQAAQQATLAALQSRLEETRRQLAPAADQAGALSERVARLAGRMDALEAASSIGRWEDPVMQLSDRQEAQADRLQALEDGFSEIAPPAREAATLAAMLRVVRAQQGWEEEGEALALRLAEAVRAQEDRVKRAEALVAANRRELIDQQRRLGLLLEEVRRRQAEGGLSPEQVKRLEAEDEHALDALYLAFEDRFRGSRADIKDRQRIYLPLLRETGAGTADRPILDVGAGRGEFLELLKEAGLEARGVDLNRSMVEHCAEAGLDCVADDAVTYLAGLPAASLGGVTGFHIIEHLPFRTMVRLFDEAFRALRSGGLVIFETPNPANVLVGSRYFYLDPTHRNPLPGETVAMIAEARGFVRVSIKELHPMEVSFAARDTVLAEQLDRLFHGPQDYALIARKA